jgi:hypothetical protein
MRIAGIAVNLASPKRPAVRLVVIDDRTGSPVIEKAEDIPSAAADIVEQLHHAARAVESRLQGLKVGRVLVRRADFSRQQGRTEGPRLRLLVEGAATSGARSSVVDTRIGTGKDIAQWCSTQKDALDNEASALVAAAGEHAKYVEAAAAALAALRV